MSLNGKLWKDILNIWEDNYILKYPKNIKKQFFWRTTPINRDMNSVFKMEFVETDDLNYSQDCSSYNSYFKNIKKRLVVAFPNLTNTAQLVVPVPVKGKKFTYVKDFIDNASPTQQKLLWKNVAIQAKQLLKKHKTIWISTHGRGVPCLHIRLDTKPNYYVNSKFKKMIKSKKLKKIYIYIIKVRRYLKNFLKEQNGEKMLKKNYINNIKKPVKNLVFLNVKLERLSAKDITENLIQKKTEAKLRGYGLNHCV